MQARLAQDHHPERMKDLNDKFAQKSERLRSLISKDFSFDGLYSPYVKRYRVNYAFNPSGYDVRSVNFESVFRGNFIVTADLRKYFLMAFNDINKICQIHFFENNTHYHLGLFGFTKKNLNVTWSGMAFLNPQIHNIFIELPEHTATPVNLFGIHTFYHELGHVVGLEHPFEHMDTYSDELKALHETSATSVMNYKLDKFVFNKDIYLTNITNVSALSGYWYHKKNSAFYYKAITPRLGIFDVEALQEMYGPNTNTHKDDTIYHLPTMSQAFASSDSYITLDTIWDAGGVDTLSAKHCHLPATLNLREGPYQWSLLFQGIDTRALFNLAYGSNIENAAGGKNKNTFYLNTLNNHVDARDSTINIIYSAYPMGNDIIYGFAPERDVIIFENMPYLPPNFHSYNKIETFIGNEWLTEDYGTVIHFDTENSLLLANFHPQDILKALHKNIRLEYLPEVSTFEIILITLYSYVTPQFQQSFFWAFCQSRMLDNFLHFSQKQLLKYGVRNDRVKNINTFLLCNLIMLLADTKLGLALSLGLILCHKYFPKTENIISLATIMSLSNPIKCVDGTLGAISGSISAGLVSKCSRWFCFGRNKKSAEVISENTKKTFNFKNA